MPSKEELSKMRVNPFAIAASRGLKPGSAKYEAVVEAVTRKERSRIGVRKDKRGSN